jgi:nucleotide-binding universal stress UspA family protein
MNEIVVGLGSVSTHDHVLDLALAEAERTSAPVRVVRCIAPYPWAATNGLGYPLSPVTVPDLTELRRASQEEVEAVVEKALARRLEPTAVAISAEILDGDPGRILTDLSAKASLTVVGGQCHGRLQRALLGSTTTYVLHHAQGPVLVVPDSTSGEAVTRVVVGLDGSESSRAALVHAVALATDLACPLMAVYVFDLTSGSVIGPWLDLPGYGETQRAGLEWLQTEVAREAPGGAVPIECKAVPGPTAKALLDEAGPSDLLVLGSRGHGGFAGLVLGSVATQCATHARGAVLVLRPRTATAPPND